ncbi:MAG: AAA family ATPase [Pseudomonadota bacterium]|uniref:AAA family ATPase n=1 Tax=Phenylobacterium sp. TaxID=1871053 RepID=UPI0025CC9DCF|nr:AAA family ATPase [Phenylobacterium sp.]MBT9470178.1 AAA family ATPase [Phenylobacterium sp.]
MIDEPEGRDSERPALIDLSHEPAFVLAGVQVLPASRELIAANGSEFLQPRIMQVLVALARRRGKVVSRDELAASCWGGRVVGEDAVNRCIQAIRRLAAAHGGFEVQTIARVGYRLSETTADPGRPDQRLPSDAPRPEPRTERRHLTALSCGLMRGVAAEAVDPEEWRAIVQQYRLAVAEVVAPFGGFVTKGLGDNLTLYFGYPEAQEDAAECAVRAGLAIIERLRTTHAAEPANLRPAVQIGVHAGLVLIVQDGEGLEFVGDTPNVALRIQAAASRDTLMATGAVQALVVGKFVFEPQVQPTGEDSAVAARRVVAPIPTSRHGSRFTGRELTPYVGREDELHLLASRWRRVQRGEGQLVLLTGEPGIGKTRLVQEFRMRIGDAPHLWVECAGERLNSNTPFHVVARMLDQVIRWRGDETPQQCIEELEAALERSGLDVAEAMPLMCELLNLSSPAKYPPLTLAPDQKRRRLLACLTAWVLNLVRNVPLIIAIEDLHWADPSSMEVLLSLVEQGALGPLMLLCTARPEFRPGWPMRAHHVQVQLDRLSREETRELVGGVAGEAPLSQAVIETVIGRTDGVPLFAEELTRLMLSHDGRGGARDIPATLLHSLEARLARTGRAKDVAQLGAVLGREFSYALIAAVSPQPADQLQADLAKLTDAELIYVRGVPPEASYQFKHALILDAAYEGLARVQRRELHTTVARVVAEQFPALAKGQPEILARHWAEAGQPSRAVDAWAEAANLAASRHAYREAVQSFRHALASLEAVEPSPTRDARELELLVLLSEVVSVVHGPANEEYSAVSEQITNLAERSGALQQLVFQMLSRYVSALMSGQHLKARALADQFLDLARREGGDAGLRMAYMAQITSRHAVGDMVGAEAHMGSWTEAVARSGPSPFLGEDVMVHGSSVETAYLLGQIDLARRRAAQIVATAEASGSPFEAAAALQTAAWLAVLLDEPDRAAAIATAALAIARDNSFHTANQITCILAWTTARLGDTRRAVILAESCFEGWSGGGFPRLPEARRLLAQIRALDGDVDGAMAGLDEVCVMAADNPTVRAAHLIARGALRLSLGQDDAAAADLRAAIDVARPLQTVSLELRATLPLAQSLAVQGQKAEARALLEPVYRAFTEGFDTADLKTAKAFLDQLS